MVTSVLMAIFPLMFLMADPVMAELERYFGVMVKVDPANSYIVVMNPNSGGRFRFTISENTKVSAEETGLAVVDLKMGTPVIVEYEWTGDNYTAHSIAVQSEEE